MACWCRPGHSPQHWSRTGSAQAVTLPSVATRGHRLPLWSCKLSCLLGLTLTFQSQRGPEMDCVPSALEPPAQSERRDLFTEHRPPLPRQAGSRDLGSALALRKLALSMLGMKERHSIPAASQRPKGVSSLSSGLGGRCCSLLSPAL